MKKRISDQEVVRRAQAAVRMDLEKKKILGLPITVYDRKTQIIYEQNSDGTKTVVGRRRERGRYSERITDKT